MSLRPADLLLVIIFSFSSLLSFAQTNAPYSHYGLGYIRSTGFTHNDAMAGLSMGVRSSRDIIFSNPAAYSAIKWTTLAIGIGTKGSVLNSDSLTQNHFNANLSYLSFAFPVSKRWGSSIGLMPFSKTSYKVTDKQQITGVEEFTNIYEGSGGLNKFYFGNGFEIISLKDSSRHALSLGANISFLFGSMAQTTLTEFPDTSNNFNIRKKQDIVVQDFLFDLGLQYTLKFKKELYLTLGAKTGISPGLNARRNVLWERYTYGSWGVNIEDTIAHSLDESGKIILPVNIGGGFTLVKTIDNLDKWLIGADFTYSDWSDYRSFGATDSFTGNWRIAFGGQIIPDPKSIKKYWKHIRYRMGLFYTNNYLMLNNIDLTEFGITFGVGLPLKKAFSIINLSIELGQLGTTDNNLIKEQYIKVKFGFTFNDRWFIKRKFD